MWVTFTQKFYPYQVFFSLARSFPRSYDFMAPVPLKSPVNPRLTFPFFCTVPPPSSPLTPLCCTPVPLPRSLPVTSHQSRLTPPTNPIPSLCGFFYWKIFAIQLFLKANLTFPHNPLVRCLRFLSPCHPLCRSPFPLFTSFAYGFFFFLSLLVSLMCLCLPFSRRLLFLSTDHSQVSTHTPHAFYLSVSGLLQPESSNPTLSLHTFSISTLFFLLFGKMPTTHPPWSFASP